MFQARLGTERHKNKAPPGSKSCNHSWRLASRAPGRAETSRSRSCDLAGPPLCMRASILVILSGKVANKPLDAPRMWKHRGPRTNSFASSDTSSQLGPVVRRGSSPVTTTTLFRPPVAVFRQATIDIQRLVQDFLHRPVITVAVIKWRLATEEPEKLHHRDRRQVSSASQGH